jgi:hypothetical protein
MAKDEWLEPQPWKFPTDLSGFLIAIGGIDRVVPFLSTPTAKSMPDSLLGELWTLVGHKSMGAIFDEKLAALKAEFDESKHPRDERGRFASGEGETAFTTASGGSDWVTFDGPITLVVPTDGEVHNPRLNLAPVVSVIAKAELAIDDYLAIKEGHPMREYLDDIELKAGAKILGGSLEPYSPGALAVDTLIDGSLSLLAQASQGLSALRLGLGFGKSAEGRRYA